MSIYLLIPARIKYEKYFKMNEIDMKNSSDEMIPKYKRLLEIWDTCERERLSEDEARERFDLEIGELYHSIKCREFVCKVGRVAYLGGMKLLAEFWGDYYTIIDFEEVLELPEVQERHPEFEKLRDPEVFHTAYPAHYHVFFGERLDRIDVTSDFIWHFGKRVKEQIDVNNYDWIRGW